MKTLNQADFLTYLEDQATAVIADGGRPVGYIGWLREESPYTQNEMAFFVMAFSPSRRARRSFNVKEGDIRDQAARAIAWDVMDIVDARTGKCSAKWRINNW